MQTFTIITGSSQGLGQALVESLLTPGNRVLGMARHWNAGLQDRAQAGGAALEQWRVDLAHPAEAAARLEALLDTIDVTVLNSATLINNAALIPDIAPLTQVPALAIAQALRVGLEAPMLLTAAFLRASARWSIPRRVLNISSGLGRRPMASQATYCALKAGLDHFTRCLSLEQQGVANPARVCALAPGVIATRMQDQMRATAPQDFPDRAAFVALHESGALQTPQLAASKVLAFLQRPDFGTQPVADIREP